MQRSWRIGRIAGIDIRVHATFPILLAWAALMVGEAPGSCRGDADTVACSAAVHWPT